MALRNEIRRYRKYVCNAAHLTPRKLLNILRSEWRLRTNDPVTEGLYPYVLFVDLSNACNLRCPLCPTGLGTLKPRPGLMTLENYRKVVTPLRDYLYQVFLYNNTEPFLNKDIYEIVRFNRVSNIGSVVSSNLSLKIDSQRLVESGLEFLIVSGDGVTQEVYEQYRVRGKLQLVIDNVRRIVQEKKRLKARRPFVEWQCLVNRKNEDQLAQIRDFAYGLGVDGVRFEDTNFYALDRTTEQAKAEQEWLPLLKTFRTFESHRLSVSAHARRKACRFLWTTAVVNSNGGVNPCCLYDTEDWGNLLEESLPDVWNNERYGKARRLSDSDKPAVSGTICDHCRAPSVWK